MRPFEFGRFVAGTLRQLKLAADAGLDNELSPDAIAGMQQAKKMLQPSSAALASRPPLKRQPYDLPPITAEVHRADPLPSSTPGKFQPKYDFQTEYDAWRMAQGLTPGHGTPATQLPSGVADAPLPVKLPTR